MCWKGLVCVSVIVLSSALPVWTQDAEDLANVQEIANFVGGPTSDAFPNSKPETSNQQEVAIYCGLGKYNASASSDGPSVANFDEVLYEMEYVCGEGASNATNSAKATAKAGDPDTSQGTSAALRGAIVSRDLITLEIWAFICNVRNATIFLELAATAASLGNTWEGGYPTKAVFVEQFYKPTAAQRATKVINELQGKPKTLAIGSDTMVIVSQLSAPAPATTALFLFHATIGNNFCNWATDFNYFQVPYPVPKGLSKCKDCLVHEGFLSAFQTVTNSSTPSQNILATWEALSGIAPADVKEVLCIGHSLGAALATLCGPWAKSTFPNAKVIVYHSGSPRVFNPAVFEWWDTEIGADNSYRVVNNMDVVPSLPPQVITGNYGLPLKYKHVGSPIWMYREGRDLPGNYTGYAIDRPDLYTGRLYDHVRGYILGLRQIVNCNF